MFNLSLVTDRAQTIRGSLARPRELAGYDNRLVHDYATATQDDLWEIMRTRFDDLAALLRRLLDHLGGVQ